MTPFIFLFVVSLEVKIDRVLSVFENSTQEIQYCYMENIHDGRGYTAGKAGFTSATGDLYEFVKKYQRVNHNTVLAKYLPELKRLAADSDPDVKGLRGLLKDYRAECHRSDFVTAQDELVDEMYKSPAREYVKSLGLASPLAYLIVYDTLIQQGDGDDPDSFKGVLERMKPSTGETEFLSSFLKARESILMNASDEGTRVEWRKSVDRVYALRRILEQGNFNLTNLSIKVWGENWKILE